jgi:hypothetical protein
MARSLRPARSRLFLAAGVLALFAVLIPAALSGAAPKPAPSDPGLLPDIRTVVPRHLGIQNQQQHDYLRFSNGIANTGAGLGT